MSAGFPHHSRPGHYAPTLTDELEQYVGVVAEALIPSGDGYPSGREAQVHLFVADRASQQDARLLTAIAERWPATSVNQATANLAAMEREDATSFQFLREYVYHGYYSSRRVLATMVDRGYRYHGAPQPLGYPQTEELLVPSAQRGSFIATSEVTRATDRPA